MTIEAVSAVVTALGVCFAAWQIKQNREQARTQFEDNLDAQYRSIIQQIPADVLLDKKDIPSCENYREHIYNYLDLSNEQIHLRQLGRISTERWVLWCQGIQSNLQIASFGSLWQEVKEYDQGKEEPTFTKLTQLEASNFTEDPKNWGG